MITKEEVDRLQKAYKAASDLAKHAGEKWFEASRKLTEQNAAEKEIVFGSVVVCNGQPGRLWRVESFWCNYTARCIPLNKNGVPTSNRSFRYWQLSDLVLHGDGTGK